MSTSISEFVADARPPELLGAVFRRFDQIETEPVDWLWKHRLATKVCLLAGYPGKGKSQSVISWGAIVTTGGRWPDNTPCETGSVIFICSEDDAGDTIKPRLEAAGADVGKAYILDAIADEDGQKQWSLETDCDRLEQLIADIGDVRLVVIDPISAYLGQRDGHSNTDVRGALQPLSDICSRHKVCVLMISHLNKSVGMDAMSRVNGSGAFVAASRVAYLVGDHPDDENARVIVPLKNNLGDDRIGFAYHIAPITLPSGIETSRVEWHDGVVCLNADDVLSRPRNTEEDLDANSAKGEAATFLVEALRNGPAPAREIYRAADDVGIAEKTLKRAKKALHIRSVKLEFSAGWYWELPSRSRADEQGGQQGGPHINDDPLDPLDPLGAETNTKGAKGVTVFVRAQGGPVGSDGGDYSSRRDGE